MISKLYKKCNLASLCFQIPQTRKLLAASERAWAGWHCQVTEGAMLGDWKGQSLR